MVPQRTELRNFIVDLLKDKVDVNKNVFFGSPSPIYLDKLPCVLVCDGGEGSAIFSGDQKNPVIYEKTKTFFVDVCVEDASRDDSKGNYDDNSAEDHLDKLVESIEYAFGENHFLEDADGTNNRSGGVSIGPITPFKFQDDNREATCQRITVLVPFNRNAQRPKKLKDFNEFTAEIYPV